ncbi:ATP-binding cassette sub-family G member 4 [Sarcoptes scabiei]|uniref:ATP-binding cassette sub-family G member 4 n=1 Tax=Sarcoptes scabiei TaxID=52283 RepID=A0A834RDJ5_SARSC|nr:ATP-binding cassette sub-family G member 4 [Sarcoptes scabiei]
MNESDLVDTLRHNMLDLNENLANKIKLDANLKQRNLSSQSSYNQKTHLTTNPFGLLNHSARSDRNQHHNQQHQQHSSYQNQSKLSNSRLFETIRRFSHQHLQSPFVSALVMGETDNLHSIKDQYRRDDQALDDHIDRRDHIIDGSSEDNGQHDENFDPNQHYQYGSQNHHHQHHQHYRNRVGPNETASPARAITKHKINHFQVIWKNINYSVKVRKNFHQSTRKILKNLSGYFQSGEVTAIMGPSGAGKSTFLEILAGRKSKGLTGHLKVRNIEQLRIAYVPQNNYLMHNLTVFETLKFSCEISSAKSTKNKVKKVEKIIKQFGIMKIRDTMIERCSGGQQRRISIAVELFSNPNCLILDEPTTGLDSASCASVVKILKEIVQTRKYPMATLATIHQPSYAVFTDFNLIYIINRYGQNLYIGSPSTLLSTLEKIQYPCDRYNSPPDYIIEIAAEDHGSKPMRLMQKEFKGLNLEMKQIKSLVSYQKTQVYRKTELISSTLILLNRSGLRFVRRVNYLLIRIVVIALLSVWFALTFGRNVGLSSGCLLRKLQFYNIPTEKLSTLFEDELMLTMQNNCCIFFGLIVGTLSGITSTVLEFPKEMHILMKEYRNGWYTCLSYFINKTIIDIPVQIILSAIYVVIIYPYTNQPAQYFREFYYFLLTFLVSLIAESIGSAVSAIFMNAPSLAVFVAGSIPLPMMLVGGFMVRYERMPFLFRMASWTSLMKYAYEGLIVDIYGFERCRYNYDNF